MDSPLKPTPSAEVGNVLDGIDAALLSAIVDQTIIGIVAVEDGALVFVNQRFCEMFKHSRADLIGMTVERLAVPHERPLVLDALRQRLESGDRVIEREFRGLCGDGSEIDVHVFGSIARASGRTILVGVVEDISTSRTRERALNDLSQMSQAILENSSDLVVAIDGKGVIKYASPSLKRLGGFDPSEVTGHDIMEFTHPDDRGRAAKAMADVLQHPADLHPAELRWRRKDGTFVVLESIAKNLIANPAMNAIIINARDVTARRAVESALRESEARFRGMIEQSVAGACIIGADGRFLYANPKLATMLGCPPDFDLVGKEVLEFVSPKDRGLVRENMRLRLSGEERRGRYTFEAIRKDGTRITIDGQGTRGVYHGRPVIITIVQDVTELRRTEDEVQRNLRRFQQALQSTITVISSISELRDPYTYGHERRVGEIAAAIGRELGLSEDAVEGLKIAGYLHDIGKISVPAEILAKPARLLPVELDLIKQHAQQGYEILRSVDFGWPVAKVAWQHHERMDGSGYPRGIRGDEIIFEARIVAVADVLEAISSHRPYRPAYGLDAALAEIEKGSGTQFDQEVVQAALRLFRERGYTIPE